LTADSEHRPVLWFVPPLTYRSADDTGRDVYYELALYFDSPDEVDELLAHFRR
jgi:hypothetical protein